MNTKTNSHKLAEIGTELTPEQLAYVSGGSPFLLGPREIVRWIGETGRALVGVASDAGHAVVNAGKQIASFFSSLF